MKSLIAFSFVSLFLMANSWGFEGKYLILKNEDIDSVVTTQGENIFVEELEDAAQILGGIKLNQDNVIKLFIVKPLSSPLYLTLNRHFWRGCPLPFPPRLHHFLGSLMNLGDQSLLGLP